MDTKGMILSAMRELLKKKKFSQITVSEIARTAGVSKTTFYNKFQDKYDLMNSYYTEVVKEVIMKNYAGEDNLRKYVEIWQFIFDNQNFFGAAFEMRGQNSFYEFYCDFCRQTFADIYRYNTGQNRITEEYEYKIYALSVMFANLVEYWLKKECSIPVEQMAQWSLELTPDMLVFLKQKNVHVTEPEV
ncbi:MAG: TetR family transcriptional regulator [Lachnospiraceae bacterium]|nr:TetR family transcriptional regulator [Lachnospiraceae bacterium]